MGAGSIETASAWLTSDAIAHRHQRQHCDAGGVGGGVNQVKPVGGRDDATTVSLILVSRAAAPPGVCARWASTAVMLLSPPAGVPLPPEGDVTIKPTER